MKLPKAFPEQDHMAHIEAHKTFMKSRMVQVNPQVYALFQGHISEHISQMATIEIMQVMREDPQMVMLEQQNPEQFMAMAASQIAKRINILTTQLIQEEMGSQQPDPLVQLKQRELDLKAMDIQMRAKANDEKLDQQQAQFEDRLDFDEEKLQVQSALQQARRSQ